MDHYHSINPNVQPVRVSDSQFMIDASEIGLPPGKWPSVIVAPSLSNTPLRIDEIHRYSEEITKVVYRNRPGAVRRVSLTVLND